jgi:hypothetical protein
MLLAAAATLVLGTSCEKKNTTPQTPAPAPVPAAPAAPAPAAPATPTAPAPATTAAAAAPLGATSLDDFDPATDPVLGWWRVTLDADDDKKVSILWPVDAGDTRSLRTLRFLNDSMATNGCCAGAEWAFAAPKFYKIDRDIHELYYLADKDTLYFLAREDPAESPAVFKKIIAAIAAGKTVDALATDGLVEAPAKFVRLK